MGGAVLIAAASAAQSAGPRTASRVSAGLLGACGVGGLASPGLMVLGGLGFLVLAIWTVIVGIAMVRNPVGVPHTAFATA